MNLNRFLLFLKNIAGVGDSALRKLIISNCFVNLNLTNLDETLIWIKNHSVYFKNPKAILNLTIDDLNIANEKRRNIEISLNKIEANYISVFDKKYPYRVRTENFNKIDFPIILFYKGNISLLNQNHVSAVIGTRNITNNGITYCKKVTKDLVINNHVILSGLALGCDSVAHKECILNKGKTIAVLGSGVDVIYPAKNKDLAKEILDNDGLLISEYEPGFKAAKFSLVQRDRLQALFSDDIYVIQTDINGGTMHAVDASAKYGRIVNVLDNTLLEESSALGNEFLLHQGKRKITF